jgi:hypothetical protein
MFRYALVLSFTLLMISLFSARVYIYALENAGIADVITANGIIKR